jgi:hypothetical protein
MRTAIAVGAVVGAIVLGLAQRVEACSCILASIENNYQFSEHVLRVRAVASFGVAGDQRYYLAQITADPYKGCLHARRLVLIQTGTDSAACGIALRPGVEYLVFADRVGHNFGVPVLNTGLCNGNAAWSDVTDAQQAFLDSRFVCCGKSCECYAASQVECFADPCQVSSCSVEGATCQANYCGSCNAEWSDPGGVRVCL